MCMLLLEKMEKINWGKKLRVVKIKSKGTSALQVISTQSKIDLKGAGVLLMVWVLMILIILIDCSELVDIPLIGKKHTWFGGGNKRSRMDRFMVSLGWLNSFKDICQRCLKRSIFDHCPLLVYYELVDWGPKPFWFLDCWLYDKNLASMENEWNSMTVSGKSGFKLKSKLCKMKFLLRSWNKNTFGNLDKKIESLENKVDHFDSIGNQRDLSLREIDERKRVVEELWHAIHCNESL
ncbi:hypothetical protein CRYUN_Cryun41cG0039700 [Craigia yunnanensis]